MRQHAIVGNTDSCASNFEPFAIWRTLTCDLRLLICLLFALFFGICSPADAQQRGNIPRLGILMTAPAAASTDRMQAFREGLRDLGYVEGKTVVIEWRSAEGHPERGR